MPASRVIVVFAKYPEPGKVKTRLIACLGSVEAAKLYRACLALTLECLNEVPDVEVTVAVTPDRADFSEIVGKQVIVVPQGPGDLGERLDRITRGRFDAGYERVVLVGGDCPGMQPADVIEAFSRLENHDVVIGPAVDGGYYLLGLRQAERVLFESIPWGSGDVARRTRAAARASGLTLAELTERRDIDEYADLAAILDELPDGDARLQPFRRLVGRLLKQGDPRAGQ